MRQCVLKRSPNETMCLKKVTKWDNVPYKGHQMRQCALKRSPNEKIHPKRKNHKKLTPTKKLLPKSLFLDLNGDKIT